MNYDNHGEISDVAVKRKIRDRLQDNGHAIYVQSDDRKTDEFVSLRERAEKTLGPKLTDEGLREKACTTWLDVRAFGQLFAFTGKKGSGDGLSVAIRGPVTVRSAVSVAPVEVTSTQITKSVSSEGDGTKRGADTMGMKHRVDRGIYVFYGAMNPQLAERTGFSDDDADAIKAVLPRLFENDESAARPAGSMEVLKLLWWRHDSRLGRHSSAKVHRSLDVAPDGSYNLAPLEKLTAEEIDGF